MSFREWLPITKRNRVALAFAFAAMVIFVVWNCLPNYESPGFEPDGIVATSLWPEAVFSPDIYLIVFKDPNMEGFLVIAAFMVLILNALVTLATVPFWKLLHASPYIRLPLAIINLLGGCVILRHLRELILADVEPAPYWVPSLLLIALGMFALSAALFTFRNELGLRREKEVHEATGKGGAA